jgi:uncharacterized protein (TIGR00730 family)
MSARPARTPDEELLTGPVPGHPARVQTDALRIARISGELAMGFAALGRLERAVSMFGSARTPPGHPDYRLARDIAARLGREGFGIVTGGGGGVMEAANRGARDAGAPSVGLTIDVPHEPMGNGYVDLPVHFHYFFTRKVMFVRYASAFVVLPGGFGTLDELFECLTLIQTSKIRGFPIVLVGSDYWTPLVAWLRDRVAAEAKIDAADLDLLAVVDGADAVVEIVRRAAARTRPR